MPAIFLKATISSATTDPTVPTAAATSIQKAKNRMASGSCITLTALAAPQQAMNSQSDLRHSETSVSRDAIPVSIRPRAADDRPADHVSRHFSSV